MERCPNCSARVSDGPSCRRCGMDLSNLIRTEQAAERLILQGLGNLLAGDSEAARSDLSQARALRGTPLIEHLLAFLDQGITSNRPGGQRLSRDGEASA